MQTPRQAPARYVGSAAVCPFESVGVTVFEREVPTLLVAGSPLLEILLSHHVQLGISRQNCLHRRLLTRFQTNRIRRPLLCSCTASGAMSIERSPHTTNAASAIITKKRTGLNSLAIIKRQPQAMP